MTGEEKVALLEEIRSRRTPIIKPIKSKQSGKGVTRNKRQRKPKSIEEALAYMNEIIANKVRENNPHE